MALEGTRTFVGFGFGPIQAGLFLYEAFCSGAFRRLVVAEIVPEVVAAVRRADGYFSLNIAHADHIEHFQAGPVEILNPAVESDRAQLVEAIAEAQEIRTALPSVTIYVTDSPASVHRILADGLSKKAEKVPRAPWYMRRRITITPPRYWNPMCSMRFPRIRARVSVQASNSSTRSLAK